MNEILPIDVIQKNLLVQKYNVILNYLIIS